MTASAGSPYRELLDAAVDIAGSEAASIQVFDRTLGGLRLVAWQGFDPISASFWELVVTDSHSMCGMALASGERVVIPDLEAEASLAGSDDLNEYRRSGLRAVQSTPLVAEGRVAGMLSTHWRSSHEPSAADLARIDSLARKCALVIAEDHARLRHEASTGSRLLHEVNQRIHDLAAQFDSLAASDSPQEYLCECGCGQWIVLTRSEFDARLVADLPLTAHGHVVARARAERQVSQALRSDSSALRAEARQKPRKSEEIAKRRPEPPGAP